jgi:hypothetical protein
MLRNMELVPVAASAEPPAVGFESFPMGNRPSDEKRAPGFIRWSANFHGQLPCPEALRIAPDLGLCAVLEKRKGLAASLPPSYRTGEGGYTMA